MSTPNFSGRSGADLGALLGQIKCLGGVFLDDHGAAALLAVGVSRLRHTKDGKKLLTKLTRTHGKGKAAATTAPVSRESRTVASRHPNTRREY